MAELKQWTGPATAADFGAYTFWPDNLDWSFQAIRLVSQSYAGAADFSEVYGAIRDLSAGDVQGWYDAFTELASRLDAEALQAREDGHLVSAKDLWFRAANYFRASSFFFTVKDDRVPVAIDNRRRTFQSAGELCTPRIEPVEIPYEGSSFPAYVISPVDRPKKTPAAILFGGLDAISEEMYFVLGRALAERGFTVLSMDGPGQGEALRRGLPARFDYEVPVAAAVDFLEARNDVAADQIVLVGQSLGGYYAARAAAFESRLRACVVWGAVYGLGIDERVGSGQMDEKKARLYATVWGAESAEELIEATRQADLEGVASKIACPTLVLHAENDVMAALDRHAQRLYDDITAPGKKLIVYPAREPGCTHCQLDSLPGVQRDICDWLELQVR